MLQKSFPKCFIKLRFAQMFTFYQQEVFAHLEKSQANEFFFSVFFFFASPCVSLHLGFCL